MYDELAKIAPVEFAASDAAQPTWRLYTAGAPQWQATVGERGAAASQRIIEWHSAQGALVVVERVCLDMDHRAVTSHLTLRNTSADRSVSVANVSPLYLPLGRDSKKVEIRFLGGGMRSATFPPEAYREHVYRQEGRTMRIEQVEARSGVDGRSSNGNLPVYQTHFGLGGIVTALEWSGPWAQSILDPRTDEGLVLRAQIPTGKIDLHPGEVLELPVVHVVGYRGDPDAGGNAFRRYVYDTISPDLGGHRPIPPLSYDHWFGIGCEISDASLRRQVDRAAELGLEYFVIDAGWYSGCGAGYHFHQGTGNWEIGDSGKFPEGLEPIAAYVREKGMQLGLWFEPERGHRTSQWVREHPEWYFDNGTEFLHLNLALPEVQEHVIRTIGGYIERLDLKWSRWDYNHGPLPFWQAAEPSGKISFQYMAGLYRVLDTLMQRYPDWLIECCASGGRRIDLGTLRRAHTTWMSDHTEEPSMCRTMQAGFARFLPGMLANSSVAVDRDQGDAGFDDDAIVSRMLGALSFDGDIASWSPLLTSRAAQLVATYRSIRHLLVKDFYPLCPQPEAEGDAEVVEFVDYDGEEAVVFVFGVRTLTALSRIRPRGLNATSTYAVTELIHGGQAVSRTGAEMQEGGLGVSTLPPGVALYHLEATSLRMNDRDAMGD